MDISSALQMDDLFDEVKPSKKRSTGRASVPVCQASPSASSTKPSPSASSSNGPKAKTKPAEASETPSSMPAKPLAAMQLFLKEHGLAPSVESSERWAKLGREGQKPFQVKAVQAIRQYHADLAEWKDSADGRKHQKDVGKTKAKAKNQKGEDDSLEAMAAPPETKKLRMTQARGMDKQRPVPMEEEFLTTSAEIQEYETTAGKMVCHQSGAVGQGQGKKLEDDVGVSFSEAPEDSSSDSDNLAKALGNIDD
jgi:hypothetical protein